MAARDHAMAAGQVAPDSESSESEQLARPALKIRVYLVPAFTGLGAPLLGPGRPRRDPWLTRDSGIAGNRHCALLSVVLQTRRPDRRHRRRWVDLNLLRVDRRHGRQ